jgi:hypothetical protein
MPHASSFSAGLNTSSASPRYQSPVFLKTLIDTGRDQVAGRSQESRAHSIRRDPDTLDLSPMAHQLSTTRDHAPVRRELVDRVRDLISSGAYDTPDLLDHAADLLIDRVS